MPPKIRITRDAIVNTAVDIVRSNGTEAINVRSIAKELNCSTQPIFSNFTTMDELRFAVISAADKLYQEYTKKEIESGKYPIYKATGMAYIRFAREEKELFKLLYMRDRRVEDIPTAAEEAKAISDIVQTATGFTGDKAKLFHLEMWAYVHGIAAMTATNYMELDSELISEMITDVYQGLKTRYEAKG